MSVDPKRRRILRACDRCRFKKTKCDGGPLCGPCERNDSPCVFRTRRSKDAKNYYLHLHQVEHEALQRMYSAFRKGRGFPGTLPDESSGEVTTHAILQGLGLVGADDDESGFQDVSPSSGVRAVGPSQKGATRTTPSSSSSSLSDQSTATSQSHSFDRRASHGVRSTQQTIPSNESWPVDLDGSTKQNYLATLDTREVPWPINFSLQEPMPKQANAQQITEPPISPTTLDGQPTTSQCIDFDRANYSGFFHGTTQDPLSWSTNIYSTMFDMQI